ncbi:MAG TPA: chemotaxis protein CheA [Bacteroidota bacterium]|nr:chemotaxis protein CheA [Bacteroidota bacterium]
MANALDNEMKEILESFLVESNEILEKLGQDLLALEKDSKNGELHNVIFRAVHTIKGTSSFLGFDRMTQLAHKFEDVLNKIRKGELVVTSDKMDVMFEAYDLLKDILRDIESGAGETVPIDAVAEKLKQIAAGTFTGASDAPAREPEAPAADEANSAGVLPSVPVQVSSNILGEEAPIVKLEALDDSVAVEKENEPEHPQKEQTQTARGTNSAVGALESTIRVDVGRLDVLMNLAGELVLGRNRLAQISHQLNEEYDSIPASRELTETSSHIDFITTELQMAVMKIRMVPIGKVFNKLPRLVRELSKDMKKEIDLEILGEETELDKSLIEELNDPLVHMLRNAADHGVELPEARLAAGKPATGKIVVKAEHEGNHIVISIADDGEGMDPDVLKQKAIEKGLITEAAAAEMTEQEAFNLIFYPGFSTAKVVTNVSGRGVGMDVVRTNVQKLKGTIDIISELGKGSTFRVKLPLTLAIIQALLVESNKEIFSIPLDSVIEVVRISKDDIEQVGGREVIRLRNTVLPLARLSAVLGTSQNKNESAWTYIVIVGLAEQRLGVVVDSLLGQKEVVIKSISEYLGTIRGIAGSTILGDGRVIMIVDVGELMRMSRMAA